MPPVTPAADIDLMENDDIDPQTKHILVVGCSWISGSPPLAHMLRNQGAIVTFARPKVSPEMIESLLYFIGHHGVMYWPPRFVEN
jgi:5,10-methylene-tetrahydrofolate dehydrogenase/methenyl tetrahydrofolate cyclohydrolase